MRIFDRVQAGDTTSLKLECIDLIGMSYTSLGQKPDKEQMKGMAQLLYNDLVNYHSNLTMQEIAFAFDKGLRNAEQGTSAFINVRTWSVWIKDYKDKAIEKHSRSDMYWVEDKPENALAGQKQGLKPILVEHGFNMDNKDFPLAKNWKEIYDIVQG